MAMIQNNTQMRFYNDGMARQNFSGSAKTDILEKYALILTVLACLVCTVGSSVGAFVVVAAFALLVVKPEYLLGPILFFTIFDDYMLVMEGASISRFVTLFFIAGVVLLILKKGVIKRETLLFLVLMLLGVALSYWGIKGYTSFPISYILNILLAIVMVNFAVVNKERVAKQLYSIAVLSVLYVYVLLAMNGFDSLVDGMRLSISEDVNSNALAMGLAIVMAILASNLVMFGKHKILNVLLMVATCVGLFLTGSRTGLIAGVATTFIIYILGTNQKGSRKKAIIFSVVSITILAWIYSYLQKSYPLLMQRFTVEDIEESGGTGRIDVWKAYFKHYFPKYWLLGLGFDTQNLYYAVLASNGVGHGAHNLIVEILSKTGVIGAGLYFLCFAKYFSKAVRNLRENKYLLCSVGIFLASVINGIGEDILTSRFLWFGIGLGYLLINRSNEKPVILGGKNGC